MEKIKREDFKFGDEEKYIDDEYVYETNKYVLTIPAHLFTDDAIEYANHIINIYLEKEKEIKDIIVDSKEGGIAEFYYELYGYDNEYIKSKLGRPYIDIMYEHYTNNIEIHKMGFLEKLKNKILNFLNLKNNLKEKEIKSEKPVSDLIHKCGTIDFIEADLDIHIIGAFFANDLEIDEDSIIADG